MDAATPSKNPRTDQIFTPEKPTRKAAAAAAAAAEEEQIWTPEKTAAAPRRPRNGAVAFSVKEVRRAALGLRRPEMAPSAAAAEEEDELVSVERELGVGAARSPVKRKAEVKLPESYEMLCEFFNCFESSARLLRMKGSKATFPNICASIQHLSERRFTYSHLAQLKYIMPEAIVINKILLRDEATCCMKPDLQVNLLVSAVENVATRKGETGYAALRRIFRQRLVDFFREHPEGDDIPEHELPHPFNQTRSGAPQATPKVAPEPLRAQSSSCVAEQQLVAMSHMSLSFKRRFSQRSANSDATTSTSSPLAKVETTVPSPLKRKLLLGSGVSDGTPAKFASTPVRLMAATPGLETPRRPISATGYETPPLKAAKRSARAKLFMTPTKAAVSTDEENESTSVSAQDGDDELLSFLPKSLLQSVKEKEKRSLEERQMGYTDQVKREQLIASLPSTFDIILLIYQSRQRSVMTKQELVHTIIVSNPNIADKGEVEDQLRLLQEFVPDWISEKTARTGDVLCCVDTSLSQAEVRQRLYGAE